MNLVKARKDPIKFEELPKGAVFRYADSYYIKTNMYNDTNKFVGVNLITGAMVPYDNSDMVMPYPDSFVTIS